MSRNTVAVTVRRHVATAMDDTFIPAVTIDLKLIFTGLGVLPAVIRVEDQVGDWDAVGQTRRPVLSDGTSAQERITAYERPHSFKYEVTGFTNAIGRLVSGAEGSWTFEPRDNGTLISWTYAFRPLRLRRWMVALLLAPIWRSYMRKALALTAQHVERNAPSAASTAGLHP